MKINIISCFILLLGFASISVVKPRLEVELEQKFLHEIEADESDDRPQEIQDREKTFQDGLDTFLEERLQDFKDAVSGLIKAINTDLDNKSFTDQEKLSLFSCFFLSSSTGSGSKEKCDEKELDKTHLLAEASATNFEKFKEYFEGIIGLNRGLMDQLKEVSKKINTVSIDKTLGPENVIEELSTGSSSISDKNDMEDIKKLLIDIISQAMTCRFKVVYTINWIRLRVNGLKNKAEWMTIQMKDLVNLKQKYNAIEMNSNECLKSFNEMISNPDERDDSKVKKFMNYFEKTKKEGEFISKTKEIIEKIERLDMKPGSGKAIFPDLYNKLFSMLKESLLKYLDECEQEMKDKLKHFIENRMRRSKEIQNNIDKELKKPEYKKKKDDIFRGYSGYFRQHMYGDDNAQLIEYISWRFEFYKMDNNLLERIKTDITSNRKPNSWNWFLELNSTKRIKRIVWFLTHFSDTNRYISNNDEKELMIMDIIGYDDSYLLEHKEYDDRLKELEYKMLPILYGIPLKELELEINTIRSNLRSSTDYQKMVARTIQEIESLMKIPIIQDSGVSESLETFKQKVLNPGDL